MQFVDVVAFNAVSAQNAQSSTPIQVARLQSFSVVATLAGASTPNAMLYVVVSNDQDPEGMTPYFTPTVFPPTSIASVAINDNGNVLIPATLLSYRWIQLVYVPNGTTGGTLTAKVYAIGGM